jgi:DNA-binding NtrC family response regulator
MRTLHRVAVVDDDLEMGRLVADLLSEEGYAVERFSAASEALVKFKKEQPQVLITDLKMKDIDGMMFLKKVHADYPNIVCVMMTAFGSIETAIEAMKTGAYHYIVKPFKNDEMILVVRRAMEKASLTQENKTLRRELQKSFSLESIIGKSPAMLEVFDTIKRVANANATVLIQGESGCGKELVARALHSSGSRKTKAFVAVNCTAIPEGLMESELFGHVKGSFTGAIADKKGLFEEANGGTLFLDEIGDLSPTLQAKLLRVLQDKTIRPVGGTESKEIDVRIVAATHRDLKVMVADGRFREDLFYRLNVLPIKVPPLRDRSEDIPLLVENFVAKYAAQNNLPVHGVSADAMAALLGHPWPGNVRELENLIERAVVLCPADRIEKDQIMGSVVQDAKKKIEQLFEDTPTLDQIEERYIKLILLRMHNQKDKAAKVLGINRRTLYRKERSYGLVSADVPEPAEEA